MFFYVSLSVTQVCGKRSKTVPKFTLELCQPCIRETRRQCRKEALEHFDVKRRPEASSRTTVTKFSAIRRYRFFPRATRESGHAPASQTLRFAEDAAVEIAAAGERAFGSVLGLAGGHAGPAAIDASRWLLLPLFESEEPGKMRKDVRTAEIRVALVGDVLREVAKPLQGRESGGRAALAAQGSRRARPAVSPNSKKPSA
jgi:hypothetical protein